ncbi:MAG: tetratricopeptide repeat protein [Candidatus Wallbacteria bacterium]|nr:tetratricopeptide repeat protein [Candidatus Wallbacteria bacterium]
MADPDPKRDLASAEEETRLQAVLTIARDPDEQGLKLLAEHAAGDPSPIVRYHARKALEARAARLSARRPAAAAPADPAAAGHHVGMQKVETILTSGTSDQRRRLAEALGRTRDRRYLALLDRLVLGDFDRPVRETARQARESLDEETLPAASAEQVSDPAVTLEAWLRQDDPALRAAAVRRGRREWKAPLAELARRVVLAELDPWVTVEWLMALPELGDPALAELAAELVRRRDPHVRARAARAWLELAPTEAMPFVTGLFDDADELVREAAFRSVETHDADYAVQLLVGRVSPAKLSSALRSIQWLSLMDTPQARGALVKLFGKETDGRLQEKLQSALVERLPATELPLVLELAARDAGRRDEALEVARALQTRHGLSPELFAELLREYGLAPHDVEAATSGRRQRVRKFKKTVAALALAMGRGSRVLTTHVNRRSLLLAAAAAAVAALAAQAWLVWYPAAMARRHLETGLAFYWHGDSRRSAAELESALSYDPANVRALERLADLALDDEDRIGASEATALVKAAGRESLAFRRLAARMRLVQGDAQGAVRMLEEVEAAGGDVMCRVDLGRALAASKRAEKAIPVLEEAVRQSPGFAAARLELARALAKAGRESEALDQLRRLLSDQPTHPGARRLQGELALASGDWDRAEKAFRSVLEVEANEPKALLGLGRAQERLKLPTEAGRTYKLVLERDPENADALLAIAGLSAQTGDLSAARKVYRRILDRRPNDFRATFALGLLELEHGDAALALSLFRAASELSPRSAVVAYDLGLAELKLGRPREAEEQFRASLGLKPAQAKPWIALGCLAQGQGRPREALDCYDRALVAAPDAIEAIVNSAAVRIALGEREAAEKLLRRALSLSPGQPAAVDNLALLGKAAR